MVNLDTTYFVENWKHCNKIIFKWVKNYCSLFFYCSYVLVHCSWDTNNAPGAGLKKKKTAEYMQTQGNVIVNIDPIQR